MKKHKRHHWSIGFKVYVFIYRWKHFLVNVNAGSFDLSIGPISFNFRIEANWVHRMPYYRREYPKVVEVYYPNA